MKRFVTFTVAVLLGLASAQTLPPADDKTPPAEDPKNPPADPASPGAETPNLQADFLANSNGLSMKWDTLTLAQNAASCKIYKDLTLFDLQPIRGPYYAEIDLDGDANGNKEKVEVHFCNPVLQNTKDASKKRSLVFVRNTETGDDEVKREARITSGDNSFSDISINYNADDAITGLTLVAQPTSDTHKLALCKENTPWTVSFNIKCDSTATGAL